MHFVYFSALIIKGAESDSLMCEHLLQVSTFAQVKPSIYLLILPQSFVFQLYLTISALLRA